MFMVSKVQKQVGILLVILLASSIVYVSLGDDVRIRVDDDKSTFYVKLKDVNGVPVGRWLVSGREYNKLFDGVSKLNRKSSEISVETFINNVTNVTTIVRTTPYIRGPVIIDTYVFDGKVSDVELFPISHRVEVVNGSGFFYRYEVRDLDYGGVSYSLGGETHLFFGLNMELDLESGYRWAKVYKSGVVSAQYDVFSDYEVFNVRLFDPFFDSASYSARYPIIENSTSEFVKAINDTNGINTTIVWGLTQNVSFVYGGDGGLFPNFTIATETVENDWENDTDHSVGNNQKALWDDQDYVLVSHFSGGEANDSTSGGLNGTVTVATQKTGFGFGDSFYYDCTGDYINFSRSSAIEPASSLSIEAVFNSSADSTVRMLFSKDDGSGGTLSYAVQQQASNKLRWVVKNNTEVCIVETTAGIQPNQKYHGGFEKNSSHASIYLNGVFNNSVSCTGDIAYGTTEVMTGAWQQAGFGIIQFWVGYIDEFRISNVTRSADYYFQTYSGLINNYSRLGGAESLSTSVPVIVLNAPSNNSFLGSSVTFNFSATEDGADDMNSTLIIDGVVNNTNSTIGNDTNVLNVIPGLSDGLHNWSVNVSNEQGVNSSEIRFFTVDTINPNLSLDSPGNNTYWNADFNVSWFVNDSNIDSFVWSYDGFSTNQSGANFTSGTNFTITINLSEFVGEGVKSVDVWVNDSAGNVNSSLFNFTKDTVLPFVNVTSPENVTYSSVNLDLNFTFNDSSPITECVYSLNGGSNVTLAGCANSSIQPDEGLNNVTVYVKDNASNWNSSLVWFTDNIEKQVQTELTTNAFVWGDTLIEVGQVNTYVIPVNQTSVQGIFNVTNNESMILDIQFRLSDSPNTGQTFFVNSSNQTSENVIYSSNWTILWKNMSVGAEETFYSWVNLTSAGSQNTLTNISFLIRAVVVD